MLVVVLVVIEAVALGVIIAGVVGLTLDVIDLIKIVCGSYP